MSEPRIKTKPAADQRLLVLLLVGLTIWLSGPVTEISSFLAPGPAARSFPAPVYCWLTGEGLTEGLYRIDPALLAHPEKASGYGLEELPLPVKSSSLPIAALRLEAGQPATAIDPFPGLAPFFFAPIAINRADRELLMTLPGIGPALADAIIALRQQKGKLKEPHELLEAKGIGKARLANLAGQFTFD